MKIYISADIEGITGVSTWEEAADNPPYAMRERMTKEVMAACRGAVLGGATEFLIKDAHGNGKNLIPEQLPKSAKLISGWSNHPYNMVEGLDDTFDGIIFVGYHSCAGANTSPLAHTLSNRTIRKIRINGESASEWLIYAYAASMLGVPIIAVSGDGGIVRHIKKYNAKIPTIAVQEGFGGAMISTHPEVVCERLEHIVRESMEHIEDAKTIPLPSVFDVKITFKKHEDAYKYAFYPGAKQVGPVTISYTTDDYMDVLTLLMFI